MIVWDRIWISFSLRAVLLLLVLLGFFGANAYSESGADRARSPFTFYLSTEAENRYGGNVTVNLGSIELDRLAEFVGGTEGNALMPKTSAPIDVVVVLPQNIGIYARQNFLNQVREALSKRYAQADYRIQESYVDIGAERASLLEHQAQLERLEKNVEPGSRAAELAAKIRGVTQQGLAELKTFEGNWFKHAVDSVNNSHPYNTIIAARIIAVTKLAVSGGVLISKYGLNPFSFMIGAISGGISAAFGYNARAWSEFCTSHQIPFLKNNPLIRAYNETGWFKSATINIFRSLGLSFFLRELAFLSGQTVAGKPVDSPVSFSFLFEGLGLTIPEIVLDGLMDDGSRALELKGQINSQTRSYLLWTVGLIVTAMHSFFRANQVGAAYTVAAVSWGSKLAIWGASKLLKAKTKRFILISDDVSKTANGVLVENRANFFKYFVGLGKTILQAVANRRAGKYSVSDRDMVIGSLGLGEAWNLALSDADLFRLRNDSSLTKSELVKLLNLRDTDQEVVNRLWDYRIKNIGRPFELLDACSEALLPKAS